MHYYSFHEQGDVIILASKENMFDIREFLTNLEQVQRSLFRPKITCTAKIEQTPLKKGAVPAVLPAFTGLVHTEYGWMLIHRLDTMQTPSLSQLGKSRDHDTIDGLVQIVRKKGYGSVFVDVGANFGCFSFAMRKFCQEVHAFEPQRIIHNMMAGSIALNGWLNVYAYNIALGDFNGEIELPQFDYNKSLSFGSIEFGKEQNERVEQQRSHHKGRVEYVELRRLDFYEFPRVDVLKIDAEGMEIDVLRGAIATIDRCRPIMMVEHLKSPKEALHAALHGLGYKVEDVGDDFMCYPL
jgi:FkbM family methyltransferase